MSAEFLKLFSSRRMMIENKPITQAKLFEDISNQLYQEGFVKHDYCSRLLERESSYPTGLKLIACNVAIPHINNDEVLKSTIFVSKLGCPVEWHSMENPDEVLPVTLVFNVCLAEKEKQVEVLSEIVELIQKKEVTDCLMKCSNTDQMMEVIRKEENR